MYVPWLFYSHRTIFTFYSVAFVPYVVLGLVMALGWVMGIVRPPGAAPARPEDDDAGVVATGSPSPLAWVVLALVVGLTVALFVFFWPVWTGQTIDYDAWHLRMWLPRWV
jgi:dolichyl-phosphate-mannose--protein O-mannosyl transferase